MTRNPSTVNTSTQKVRQNFQITINNELGQILILDKNIYNLTNIRTQTANTSMTNALHRSSKTKSSTRTNTFSRHIAIAVAVSWEANAAQCTGNEVWMEKAVMVVANEDLDKNPPRRTIFQRKDRPQLQ